MTVPIGRPIWTIIAHSVGWNLLVFYNNLGMLKIS